MLEYLILNNHLESAYKYFEVSSKTYKQQLLNHFNKGKRQEFLKIFHLLRKEEKLQFYIRVYFLIYSIHPTLKARNVIPQEEISAFRDYLDNKGNDLAKTNQFLQFYALPYVKKPHQHPSFKSLFKKQWVNNLTEKLNIYLNDQHKRLQQAANSNSNFKDDSQSKRTKDLIAPGSENLKSNMKSLQQKNKKLFQEVQLYKQKFSNLQQSNQALFEGYKSAFMESHNKWLQITKQLTNNSKTLIELIIKSQSSLVNHRRFQRIKKRNQKFEKMVKKQLDELLNQSQDLSIFDKPSVNQISHSASITPNISQRNITTFISIDQYIPINYISLIKDFKKMPNQQKIKILQGFSWRIIKSKNKQIRRQIIVGLIVNDLLGLMNGQIQQIMFNQNLMYYVIKLFLYISQDSYGAKVLFRNGRLYKQIVDLIPVVLQIQRYDCLQLILQTLQNIWHNKQILLELINLSIISICTNLLEDDNVKNSDELLESISTLLLNTTAINEGLDAFQKEINIFYILCQAFKQANDSNRNLIGAIIYALLGRKTMWRLAHEAKLPNFIDDLIRIDLRSNKQQLYLIQQKLITFEKGKIMNSIEYEEESFNSNLQEEVFERNEEELSTLEDYIKGHEILNTKYFLKNKEANKQIEEINDIMKQFAAKKYQGKSEENNIAVNAKKQKDQIFKKKKEMFQEVRFPQVKKKNNNYMVQANFSNNKQKVDAYHSGDHQYYSYKSPNFKQNQPKQLFSLMADQFEEEKVQNFEINHESTEDKLLKMKPYVKHQNSKNKDSALRHEQKKNNKSKQRPQYRIKKSSSLEKIQNKRPYIHAQVLKNQSNRHQQIYESHKSNSHIEQKNFQSIKSPPGQKRSRQEVLRQLNKELKAEKKVQIPDRKISAKNISGHPQQPLPLPQQSRQNVFIKKNNLMLTQQQLKAFAPKPKIRRTPPHQDDQ